MTGARGEVGRLSYFWESLPTPQSKVLSCFSIYLLMIVVPMYELISGEPVSCW